MKVVLSKSDRAAAVTEILNTIDACKEQIAYLARLVESDSAEAETRFIDQGRAEDVGIVDCAKPLALDALGLEGGTGVRVSCPGELAREHISIDSVLLVWKIVVDASVVLITVVREDCGGVGIVKKVHPTRHVERSNLLRVERRTVPAVLSRAGINTLNLLNLRNSLNKVQHWACCRDRIVLHQLG